jgi:hypothetical protein
MSVQAIAGVSATSEAKIMTVVPSISGIAAGRIIGQILDCIPFNVYGMRLSRLLFGLPLAPIGALLFLLTKGFGPRYILTNRSVQIWNSSRSRRIGGVELSEIDSVVMEQSPGQAFYRAADIRLVAASGQTLLRLSGVAEVKTFCHAIESAIQSRHLVQASLGAIAARQN